MLISPADPRAALARSRATSSCGLALAGVRVRLGLKKLCDLLTRYYTFENERKTYRLQIYHVCRPMWIVTKSSQSESESPRRPSSAWSNNNPTLTPRVTSTCFSRHRNLTIQAPGVFSAFRHNPGTTPSSAYQGGLRSCWVTARCSSAMFLYIL